MSELRLKPMSPSLAWGSLIIIIGITAALLYEPFQSTRSNQLQKLIKLEEVVSKKKALIEQSEDISIILQKAQTKKTKINTIIKTADSSTSGSFQSIIRELALKNRAFLTQIQALPTKPAGKLTILTTKVDGFASLIDLHSFLLKLSEHKPAFRVDSVNLVAVGNVDDSKKLNFSFKISALADSAQ